MRHLCLCVVLCCVRVQLCIFSWTLVEQVSLGAAPQFIVYQKRAVLAVLPLRQHLGLTKLKVSHIFIKVCNITYQSHITAHAILGHLLLMFLYSLSVLYLLLYTGLGVMLRVLEDQLRAEDGGDAGRRGNLQHHHPADTCNSTGWI